MYLHEKNNKLKDQFVIKHMKESFNLCMISRKFIFAFVREKKKPSVCALAREWEVYFVHWHVKENFIFVHLHVKENFILCICTWKKKDKFVLKHVKESFNLCNCTWQKILFVHLQIKKKNKISLCLSTSTWKKVVICA